MTIVWGQRAAAGSQPPCRGRARARRERHPQPPRRRRAGRRRPGAGVPPLAGGAAGAGGAVTVDRLHPTAQRPVGRRDPRVILFGMRVSLLAVALVALLAGCRGGTTNRSPTLTPANTGSPQLTLTQ